ncbi:conserved hypothetical protein [Anaeromyxobacter dehalogenans 2CP-1]|uniref:Uncharacterized protein n=1 Tax=Anaeromyxobacter dehalogenans (strain ATCC BAA-258 / DSM 21875 / 2CP-1) TaxID=455488 RepID=B8JF91_ANAD2|nr:hypothetical protein [Anaeromyxobacter dehalogenans]ACL64448.1 conserved hypothetical protein [Anaeromyxobacter dehalogenans 2CP-1]
MKEPVAEEKVGREQSRDGSGRVVHKTWYIDCNRDPPWYYEKVVGTATGEVLRECSEPLADHRDRGSAKFNKDS